MSEIAVIPFPTPCMIPHQLADTPGQAPDFLVLSANALRAIGRANVFCRVMLGRQLIVMQDQQLWQQLKITDPERPESVLRFSTWDDFMHRGFPLITGLSREIGYAAISLAGSDVLRSLPRSELQKFENLGNAIHLVKLQRGGTPVTAEIITAAQSLSVKEFRHLTGFGKKATVEAVVDSREVAQQLHPILAILKAADSDAIRTLRGVFEHAMMLAGDSATDAVDCVIAACREQWMQEEPPNSLKSMPATAVECRRL